jgi:hypothetical protein
MAMTLDHAFMVAMAFIIIGLDVWVTAALAQRDAAREDAERLLARALKAESVPATCNDCWMIHALKTQSGVIDVAWSTIDDMRKAERKAEHGH